MLLQIGELAKRTGLTVRTLHHYDDIGLLHASVRSEAGYRLYSQQDVARLHHIQALRHLGMSLNDIRTALERPDFDFTTLIDQQIKALEQQMQRQQQLLERLVQLKVHAQRGETTHLDDWLSILELMSMYEKYFKQDEIEQLSFLTAGSDAHRDWQALAQHATALYEQGASIESQEVQDFATEWLCKLEQNTAYSVDWLIKLQHMHTAEPSFQTHIGVQPNVVAFLLDAFAESKLQIYRKYLSEQEFAFMRQHYREALQDWPQLLKEIDDAIAEHSSAHSEKAQAIAQQWLSMLQTYAGNDGNTHAKIRDAMQHEPQLSKGTWMTPSRLSFLQLAVSMILQQQARHD